MELVYFPIMNSRNHYDVGILLIVAWATIDPDREWPMDKYAFARAVDLLKENPVAKTFYVADSSAGRRCEAFTEMLSTMLGAGLIHYISPSYTHMKVVGSPRIARVLTARIAATPEDLVAASELVRTHWRLATNSLVEDINFGCITCKKPIAYVMHTQFAGSHGLCLEHAKADPSFGVGDDCTDWELV